MHTYFDALNYRSIYLDSATNVDAWEHFIQIGQFKGYDPHPLINTLWIAEKAGITPSSEEDVLTAYIRKFMAGETSVPPSPFIDLQFVRREYSASRIYPTPLDFVLSEHRAIDRLSPWFDRAYYYAINPDVVASGLSPEYHFYHWGIDEGRRFSESLDVRRHDPSAANVDSELGRQEVARFTSRGDKYIVFGTGLDTQVYDQIIRAAEFEVRVYAPGNLALPNLKQYLSTDLETRDCFDYRLVLEDVYSHDDDFDVVMFIPFVTIGGSERYVCHLLRYFRVVRNWRVLILVDYDTADEIANRASRGLNREILRHKYII